MIRINKSVMYNIKSFIAMILFWIFICVFFAAISMYGHYAISNGINPLVIPTGESSIEGVINGSVINGSVIVKEEFSPDNVTYRDVIIEVNMGDNPYDFKAEKAIVNGDRLLVPSGDNKGSYGLCYVNVRKK